MISITAFGVSTTYTATSEILAHHFDRHKYLAFSLVVLGELSGLISYESRYLLSQGLCIQHVEGAKIIHLFLKYVKTHFFIIIMPVIPCSHVAV